MDNEVKEVKTSGKLKYFGVISTGGYWIDWIQYHLNYMDKQRDSQRGVKRRTKEEEEEKKENMCSKMSLEWKQ